MNQPTTIGWEQLAVYFWMQWWTDGKFMEARVPGLTEMAIHFVKCF